MTDPLFKHTYVLSVMSADHPGIVAAVSAAITSMGGNISACSQTVLSGYFTLITIASFPEPIEAKALADQVRGPASARSGFQVMVSPYALKPAHPVGPDVERFVVTAFGKDKPGIIHRFTEYMAGKDINIIDLYGSQEGDEFMLIAQVEVPGRWSVRMIQDDLDEMGREEGFTVRFQHENVFVATNQLRFSHSHGR